MRATNFERTLIIHFSEKVLSIITLTHGNPTPKADGPLLPFEKWRAILGIHVLLNNLPLKDLLNNSQGWQKG